MGPLPDSPQSGIINTYQIADNVNWNAGAHAWKFGVDARKYIAPTNSFSASAATTSTRRSSATFSISAGRTRRAKSRRRSYSGNSTNFYAFVNDNWRVRPNLSLNLGLRYEYKGMPRDDSFRR